MNEQEINEAIDACRPGKDDAHLPEMSGLADALREDERVRWLYDRAQRTDAAIGHVFRDCDVPQGFGDRLLTVVQKRAMESSNGIPSSIDGVIEENADPGETDVVPVAARKGIRRRYVVGAGAIAIVAAVAVSWFLFGILGRGDMPLPGELPSEVERWVREAKQSTDWSEDLAQATRRYPREAGLRAFPVRWRVARTRYDSHAILYDITPPGERFAYLFCIHSGSTSSALPSSPPRVPDSTTGGVAIGAWQRGGVVYVVAVQGGRQRYQSFVESGFEIG